MKKFLLAGLMSVAGLNLAVASELDRADAAIPSSLVVRVDGSGNQQVFKSDIAGAVKNDAEAAVVASSLKASDVIAAKPFSELDTVSSEQAWGYYYYPYYYNYTWAYSYYWYGSYYNYYPYYSYYYGNYWYYYYNW